MILDLLSDTVYPVGACKSLDQFLDQCGKFPVKRAQIYGLRQIARQEPAKVPDFATHQCKRAERKQESASEKGKLRLQAEIDFWSLVNQMCGSTADSWSVRRTGLEHAPPDIREENIPAKNDCLTNADRTRRNQLRKRQKEWLDGWTAKHIPAFFERFCTHALYRLGLEAPANDHQEGIHDNHR